MKKFPPLYAVIMAGGVGTRFWPLSRRKQPKQFLPVISQKTMIEETAARLQPQIPSSRIFTVADARQTEAIGRLLPQVPVSNRIVEPEGKNTAPSLILATARIFRDDPKAVIAALPADHLIMDKARFRRKLGAGAIAAEREKRMVTFGIPPSSPSTGYGYIHISTRGTVEAAGETFFRVKRFKEKPDIRQARAFLKTGRYFWNSGMFIWPAETFADQLERRAPEMHRFWLQMLALSPSDEAGLKSLFRRIPAISIDYALMERAQGVLMAEGDFGWSDVGAWSALGDLWMKDGEGNAVRGEAVLLDAHNCLLFGRKETALVGVRDLIIVDTEDALLICAKGQDQKVKDVVERLKKAGKTELL